MAEDDLDAINREAVYRGLDEFKAKLEAALGARIEVLGEVIRALRALVEKLDEINAHPAFKSVWTLHHVHGGVYDGPNWVTELERAKKALEALKGG
jgi:hypothetical protein